MKQKQIEKLKSLKRRVKKQVYSTIGQTEDPAISQTPKSTEN